jgi:adenylate kinase family enzyme
LSVSNFAIVKNVVKLGKLLDEKDFRIARIILEEFIRYKHVRKNDVLVLNGLPRHKGQAEAVNKMIDVKLIIYLNCKVRIVRERIRKNSGGDRIGRVDDSLWFISQKLRIFKARTLPLINYYRGKGASIISINVAEDSTPASIMNVLNGDRVFLGNWLGANSGLVSNRKDRLFK